MTAIMIKVFRIIATGSCLAKSRKGDMLREVRQMHETSDPAQRQRASGTSP